MLDSVVRIPELVAATAAAGMPAVAITDRANLFGLVKFYRAALAAGVQPIVGAEIWLDNQPEGRQMERSVPLRLVLLCRNQVGYRNLCRLLTRAWLEGQREGLPRLRSGWLNLATGEGLIALSGGRDGVLGSSVLAGAGPRRSKPPQTSALGFGAIFY